MASVLLLPSHLALHVLLLLVLAPVDIPTPPPSPSSSSAASDSSSSSSTPIPPCPAYNSALLHLLLRELLASDSSQPLTFAQLEQDLLALDPQRQQPKAGTRPAGPSLVRRLRAELARLADVAEFFDLVHRLRGLINERDDDAVGPTAPPLDRRSPLGLAVRRFALAANTLNFQAVVSGLDRLTAWVDGKDGDGTAAEVNADPRQTAFSTYLASLHSGSYPTALSNLHRFFSFPLPVPTEAREDGELDDGSQRERGKEGRHHHALLNVAAFHLGHGELEAARLNLAEALRLARASSDRSALAQCLSLARRLDAASPSSSRAGGGGALGGGEDEPFDRLCAADQLAEIGRSLSLPAPPLQEIHRRLCIALGTLDRERFPLPASASQSATQTQVMPDGSVMNVSRDGADKAVVRLEVEQGSWEALQAAVWGVMGETRLARIREDSLLGLGPVLSAAVAAGEAFAGQSARLAAVQAKALRLATRSLYLPSLCLLFDPPSLDLLALSLAQYRAWSSTVWTVLDLWARRAGAEGAREMIGVFRGEGPRQEEAGEAGEEGDSDDDDVDEDEDEDEEGWGGPHARGMASAIERDLRKAQKFKAAHLSAFALPHVLAAVETAEQHRLFGPYRTATVALADVLIDLGEGAFASGLVDDVFAQILAGEDVELQAYASLTKARAILLASLESIEREQGLGLAASYLARATTLYALIAPNSPASLQALQLAAQVAHDRARPGERDALSATWERAADGRREAGEEVQEVVRVVARGVADLGVAVSLGLS